MNARAFFFALFAAALAIACGTAEPTPPIIKNVSLTPDTGVRAGELLTVSVVISDVDGDLEGAIAEVGFIRAGETEGDLVKVELPLRGSVNAVTVDLEVHMPDGTVPGHYTLSVVIVDAAMRRSAPATAEFDVLPS